MHCDKNDRLILRRLAQEYIDAAVLPVNRQRAEMWRKLNRLEETRPLVWINEVPWHEMDVNDELTCLCTDVYLKEVETKLRRALYQWRHFQCDMVLDPVFYVSYVCSPKSVYADYGLPLAPVRSEDAHGSDAMAPVINSIEDVEKLRPPNVVFDRPETERRYECVSEIFADILPVRQRGIYHQWMSPWDQMIWWYGIERLYTDMVDRPELVHALCARFMAAVHEVLDAQERMGLLAAGSGNYRVGSGGLGITDELPSKGFDPDHVRPIDQWGTSTGQIFTAVSPAMHDEFCLQYEIPYLERFGLTCYGCCEPLHHKMGILRRIKNLRRISMSFWIDMDRAVNELQTDYVFSYKPTPAVFASDKWDPEPARRVLQNVLDKTKGCRVELIMKDISTVRNEPKRLWEWADLAMRMVEERA
jgi:hypothetical protein